MITLERLARVLVKAVMENTNFEMIDGCPVENVNNGLFDFTALIDRVRGELDEAGCMEPEVVDTAKSTDSTKSVTINPDD